VGHFYGVYGVKLLESKVNDLWILGVEHVYAVYGVKVMESKVNDLLI
jgi:hypothetical protein